MGMIMNETLEQRIKKAKDSPKIKEGLLSDYLPFIKKTISGMNHNVIDFDDMLTIAMLAFIQSIESYDTKKGSFLGYASKIIHNRIIDEERKELRYSAKIVFIQKEADEEVVKFSDNRAAEEHYIREQEQRALTEEIIEFSKELEIFKISFSELPKVCPKQKKSRQLCMDLAEELIVRPEFYEEFQKHRRIPQKELADRFKISGKTVEKYRKYIVTLVVLMMGDYPNIHTFIPKYREVGQ